MTVKKSKKCVRKQKMSAQTQCVRGSNPESNPSPTDQLPNLAASRQDSSQTQVDQRLKELTALQSGSDNKIKLQRGGGGGVEVMVKNRIKWPHEFVLTRSTKQRVSNDQLIPIQWMAVFGCTMKEGEKLEMKEHMFDYFIAFLEDANDFSWSVAKASHAVLLCLME